MEARVQIYQYNKGMLHAQLMIIDEEIAEVGGANYDYYAGKKIACAHKKGAIPQVENLLLRHPLFVMILNKLVTFATMIFRIYL